MSQCANYKKWYKLSDFSVNEVADASKVAFHQN
jgi:hypothetical protein